MQGKRYALPNTRIMLHHPSGSARGQASDIHSEARELMRLRNYVNRVLSQATGKPIEKVSTGELPCICNGECSSCRTLHLFAKIRTPAYIDSPRIMSTSPLT